MDQLIRKAIAEVLIVNGRAAIHEWKNRDRRSSPWTLVFSCLHAVYGIHWRQKPIATARERLDEVRSVSIIPERVSHSFCDMVQTIIDFAECLSAPKPLADFVASDDLAGLLKQK